MVLDIRDIVLSLDDVRVAYDCYRRMTPDFLPQNSTVLAVAVVNDAVEITVDVTESGTKNQRKVTVKGVDVLRPLIRNCIENNIMLPREGKKSILFEKNKIILHIELNLEIESPCLDDPMRIHHIANGMGNVEKLPAGMVRA